MAKIAKTVKGAHVVAQIKAGHRFAPSYFKSIRKEHVIWICRQLGYRIGASATKGQAVATIINRAIPAKAPKMRGAAQKKKAAAKPRKKTARKAAPKRKTAAKPKRQAKRKSSRPRLKKGTGAERARHLGRITNENIYRERLNGLLEFFGTYNAAGVIETARSACEGASPKTRKEAEKALRAYVMDGRC